MSGPDSLDGEFMASYEILYPRPYYDEEGNEEWESPIVTGSGFELHTEEDDTVIVFLNRLPDIQLPYAGMLREDQWEAFLESIADEPVMMEAVQTWRNPLQRRPLYLVGNR